MKNGSLTPEEMECLIHEATVDERAVLEHHLPADHPVLQQITARMKIPLTADHEILL